VHLPRRGRRPGRRVRGDHRAGLLAGRDPGQTAAGNGAGEVPQAGDDAPQGDGQGGQEHVHLRIEKGLNHRDADFNHRDTEDTEKTKKREKHRERGQPGTEQPPLRVVLFISLFCLLCVLCVSVVQLFPTQPATLSRSARAPTKRVQSRRARSAYPRAKASTRWAKTSASASSASGLVAPMARAAARAWMRARIEPWTRGTAATSVALLKAFASTRAACGLISRAWNDMSPSSAKPRKPLLAACDWPCTAATRSARAFSARGDVSRPR